MKQTRSYPLAVRFSVIAATFCAAVAIGSAAVHAQPGTPTSRPNVLIIVADDLGYSDIGAYGGEIATPNLDRLATAGVRMTHFHTAPSCSPTRAMLLTGADAHVAGLGAMAEAIPPQRRGRVGFEGVLTYRVATLAERFAAAGYRTAMAGKWHLGQDDGQRPAQRGFHYSFALLQGAANHFGLGGFGSDDHALTAATYMENDQAVIPRADFYSSDAYSDKIIDAITTDKSGRPFFAYLAFTAPHSPLQAPAKDIARYRGRYDGGWATLAQQRLKGMRIQGVLPGGLALDTTAYGPSPDSWNALSTKQRRIEARKAEIYAAMIARLDFNVGRVIETLKKTGQFRNTVILFLSDNGAAGETPERFGMMPGVPERTAASDDSLGAMGSARSFLFYGPQWSEASSAPSRLFKGYLTEGGTLAPAIWHFEGLPAGTINSVVSDVRDVAPTLLALADIDGSETVGVRQVASLEGANLAPWLRSGRADRPSDNVAGSFYGQAMVRSGSWKLLRLPPPAGSGAWQLFNTFDDPAEKRDRIADEPGLAEQMIAAWQVYADRHMLAEPAPIVERTNAPSKLVEG